MPGLREALENVYDELDAGPAAPSGYDESAQVGSGPADAVGDNVDALAADPASDGEERPRDESGKFVATPAAQEKPPPPPASPATSGQGAAAGAVPSGAAPVVSPAFKAPQSWKAAIREKWGGLPAEVQAEVVRREKEITQALQARAEAEKGAGTWDGVVRPYEAQIRAAGGNPQQYVGNLLQTAHALFYGPGHMKAPMLADLIMQAGVPPADLDQALVARMNGQAPQQRPQQAQEFRDPRLDQFFAQQEAQAAGEAEEGITSFAESREFFEDVAPTMADILDTWKAQGKKHVSESDLERAYQTACQLNDDVKEALDQRKVAKSVATVQAATQKARAASSSVRTQPAAGTQAQPTGLRASLEAAYDELDR